MFKPNSDACNNTFGQLGRIMLLYPFLGYFVAYILIYIYIILFKGNLTKNVLFTLNIIVMSVILVLSYYDLNYVQESCILKGKEQR